MRISWIMTGAALIALARCAQCDDGSSKQNEPLASHSAIAPAGVTAAGMAASNQTPLWVVSTEQSHPIKTPGVPNFGKLNDHIWRSGQPSAAGYKLLASQGLKTVVNLRQEFPQDKDLLPAGVKYIFIPIRDEHEPTQEQARQFILAASDPSNWPLLVHCHAGEGRAGTMAALVRCSLDKWDDNAVMKETNGYRSSKFLGIKPPMAGCQRKFIQDWNAAALAKVPALPGPEAVQTGQAAGLTAAK